MGVPSTPYTAWGGEVEGKLHLDSLHSLWGAPPWLPTQPGGLHLGFLYSLGGGNLDSLHSLGE